MDIDFIISLWPTIPIFLIVKTLFKKNTQSAIVTFIIMFFYLMFRGLVKGLYTTGPDDGDDDLDEFILHEYEEEPLLSIYEEFAWNSRMMGLGGGPETLSLPIPTDVRGVFVQPDPPDFIV